MLDNACCEMAELIEVNLPNAPGCVVALLCPICEAVETTPAYERLSESARRELSLQPSPHWFY